MIKCNIAQMIEYPIHTAVLVMDLALLVALGPPLPLAIVMVGGLVWLTIFFTVNSERSDKLRVVFEPKAKPAAPKPAAPAARPAAPAASAAKPAAAPAVEKPAATKPAAAAKPAAAKPARRPAPKKG